MTNWNSSKRNDGQTEIRPHSHPLVIDPESDLAKNGWAVFRSGEHIGKTTPQVQLTDPVAFNLLFGEDTLERVPASQALIVSMKAGRILPPKNKPNGRFGFVLDETGAVVSISLVQKAMPIDCWKAFSFTSPYLSFDMIFDLTGPFEVTAAAVLDFFSRTYFDPRSPDGPSLCDAFFLNDDNFGPVWWLCKATPCPSELLGDEPIEIVQDVVGERF
jgi:hypothetical protein